MNVHKSAPHFAEMGGVHTRQDKTKSKDLTVRFPSAKYGTGHVVGSLNNSVEFPPAQCGRWDVNKEKKHSG